MSPKSAGLAVKWGHKNPLVYVDGLPTWKKSGKRVVPTVAHIASGNIVIVDLRDTDKVEKGYIPRAYTIPMDTLEDAEDAFPMGLDNCQVLVMTRPHIIRTHQEPNRFRCHCRCRV
jgi:hypothetical protein